MASIPEQIIAAVLTDPTVAAVNSAVGEREKPGFVAPPRVVAVPRGAPGELRQPDRPGDNKFTDVGRILLLRDFEIHWTCHDVDFEHTEALYLNTLRAIRKYAHHTVTFSAETWEDQQEDADGFDRFGTVISFVSTIAIPVYDVRSTLIQLTATPKIATTVLLPGDGSGETVTIDEG